MKSPRLIVAHREQDRFGLMEKMDVMEPLPMTFLYFVIWM